MNFRVYNVKYAMKMKIEYIICMLIALGLGSCSDKGENQGTVYGKVNVALSVTLPEPENVLMLGSIIHLKIWKDERPDI